MIMVSLLRNLVTCPIPLAAGGSTGRASASRNDDVYLETHQFGRNTILFSISPLDENVFPLLIPKLAQTLPECLGAEFLKGA